MIFGGRLWSGRYRQEKGVREVHKAVTQKDEAQNTRQLKMESKKNTNITQTVVWARMVAIITPSKMPKISMDTNICKRYHDATIQDEEG